MDAEAEITSLAGETLALQILLVKVLQGLCDTGAGNVKNAFRQAAKSIDQLAIVHEADNPGQFRKAKAVLERLHDGCFGEKPLMN